MITLKDSRMERTLAARSSGSESSPGTITTPDGERERDQKSNSTPETADTKCPHEADGDTSEGLSTRTKTEEGPSRAEAGPSALKVVTKPLRPQHLPGNKVLLVVPPCRRVYIRNSPANSLAGPEGSKDERDVRKIEQKPSD